MTRYDADHYADWLERKRAKAKADDEAEKVAALRDIAKAIRELAERVKDMEDVA